MNRKQEVIDRAIPDLQPLVSVVMSVYNGEKYIDDAIKSILGQTYRNWELVIIDDGSNDSTKEIIHQYADDSRVKYFYHANIGLTKSLNRGIRESSGKYIARLDADDRSLPSRLEKQVKFLEENQDFLLVGSYSYIIDLSTMRIKIYMPPTTDEGCRNYLKFGHSVFVHSSVMFRKEVSNELIMYDEGFIEAQDYRLCIALATKGKLTSLEEPLCLTLSVESSITHKRSLFKTLRIRLKLSWIACRSFNSHIIFLIASVKIVAQFMKGFLDETLLSKFRLGTNTSEKILTSMLEINSIWCGEMVVPTKDLKRI